MKRSWRVVEVNGRFTAIPEGSEVVMRIGVSMEAQIVGVAAWIALALWIAPWFFGPQSAEAAGVALTSVSFVGLLTLLILWVGRNDGPELERLVCEALEARPPRAS